MSTSQADSVSEENSSDVSYGSYAGREGSSFSTMASFKMLDDHAVTETPLIAKDEPHLDMEEKVFDEKELDLSIETRGEERRFTIIDLYAKSIDTVVPSDPTEELESEVFFKQEKSPVVDIDRQLYYEMYSMFMKQYQTEKIKNYFLQSKLATYYKRKKMMYVLKEETTHLSEIRTKYEMELDALEQLMESTEREKQLNIHEIATLTSNRDAKATDVEEIWLKFQKALLEYGKNVPSDLSGTGNLLKPVEKFLKTYHNQMALISKLRFEYIQLKNKTNEKVKALEDLDHLGPGFRIMDYVQLKVDNRGLREKLEDKEMELLSLRQSCQNTMQILAHNREKTTLLDSDMTKMKERVEEVEADYEDAREQLFFLKQNRDEVRQAIKSLKLEYGLLSNFKLLRDMENAVHEIENIKDQLTNVQLECKNKTIKVQNVRAHIEYFQRAKAKMNQNKNSEELSNSSSN